MAKVTGPLYSMTASGKIADAMVHFGWKGIAVVRQWLKPANRKSEGQGDVRVILGGLGRSVTPVVNGSSYHIDATSLVTGGTTWVAELVKFIRAAYMPDGAACMVELGLFNGLGNVALWNAKALALGLSSFSLPYQGMADSFSYGMQLYELAKYARDKHASNPLVFTAAIYAKTLSTWDAADFTAFVTDIQTII
jgi:hypothetical protein